MEKICKNCGKESPEQATVCYYCGKNDFSNDQPMQPNTFQSQTQPMEQTYTTQSPIYPEKPKDNKKILIAIVAVIVVIGLIATAFFVLFTEKTATEEVDDFFAGAVKVTGAPTMSLESIASGNLQTVPAEGYGAKYYMYYNGEKVGETKQINKGTETYNGISCQKIIGTSDTAMEIMEYEMEFTMDYIYYINNNNNFPVHMDLDYKYTKPAELAGMTMSADIDWDKDTGEVTMAMGGMAGMGDTTYTYTLPTEYWGLLSSTGDLIVGYTKSMDYTMDMGGTVADISMTISVEKQEDVAVPAGTFEDCYVVSIEQEQTIPGSSSTTTNMKFWISPNGEVPKVETSSGAATGMSSFSMTQELEGYYKTN